MDRALGPRVDPKFRSAKSDLALREKKKLTRRFDSRNRPRRFPAPRSRVLTVRFATGGPLAPPGRASSTQKAGKRTVLLSQPTTRRFGTRSFQERATSMNLATHGLRAAVGLPPRVMRRAGGNTPRRALAVRAEITRIPAPDGSVERRGVTFKTPVPFDAAAAKTGIMHVGVGGFHRSHQLVRVPRNSPRAHPARRARPVAFTVPETSHSARTATRDVAKNSQRSRDRRARTRREARGASRREPRDVLREPRRPAVPRGAAMRPRARTARAARRHRIGRIRPFPVRERRGEVPVGLGVEATVSAGCRGHFSR